MMLKTRNSFSLLRSNGLFANVEQRFQVTAAAAKENSILEWEEARPFEELPRESFFGLLRKNLPGGKFNGLDFGQMMLAMRKEYGDIFVLPAMFGRPPILTTHRPEDFERVFRHEGIWPQRPGSEALQYHREKYRPEFYQGVEGLISTNGKSWGNFRSIVNPVLMQPKNARLYYKKMSQVNQQFVALMKEIRDPVTSELPANFEDYINRWTLESVAIVALDKQLGLLRDKQSNPQAAQLFKSLTEFFQYTADLEMKISPWRYFPTRTFKKLMNALDSIQNVSSGYVNEAIQLLEDEAQKGIVRPENEQSVLEKLLKIDKKVATVMAMDMLMAGVDTTSSTFTAIMLCLAKHPDKQALLREEIMRILPDKNSEFTEETMKNVPYLRACIKEAHRVYPLVVGNARITERDCVLSGYRVPAGTFISMVTLTINQNEKYFQRPTEYLPERWLRAGSAEGKCPASNELKATNPFAYLPFGFGPRMCIGKRIVDMELELGIARIIRNFHVEFNHSTDNAFKTVLMNMPNIPLKFKITDVA